MASNQCQESEIPSSSWAALPRAYKDQSNCRYLHSSYAFRKLPRFHTHTNRYLDTDNCTPITNYISQSLVLTLIYGPWGLGLFQKLDFWESFMITILDWSLLLLISKFGLAKFSKGPAGWLLGRLTQKS